MGPDTVSPTAEPAAPGSTRALPRRRSWRVRGVSLTSRILAVNVIALALLAGSFFYLDSYRTQLINERFKLARIEAQITAEALAGASRERQEALLVQIGKEQRMRLRMFDAKGKLTADSFALADPAFRFSNEPGAYYAERTGWRMRVFGVAPCTSKAPERLKVS